mmetsp:Transcript_69361/g.159313  ORF Transcript_69361/g.159313 Transcript_69361/m.159313 type:complete len:89 (-) Transcript_69361:89-355(-)
MLLVPRSVLLVVVALLQDGRHLKKLVKKKVRLRLGLIFLWGDKSLVCRTQMLAALNVQGKTPVLALQRNCSFYLLLQQWCSFCWIRTL